MILGKYRFNTCACVCVHVCNTCNLCTFLKGCVTTLWFQKNLINSSLANIGIVKDFCKLDFGAFLKAVFGTSEFYIKFKDKTGGALSYVSNLKQLNALLQTLVATVTEIWIQLHPWNHFWNFFTNIEKDFIYHNINLMFQILVFWKPQHNRNCMKNSYLTY